MCCVLIYRFNIKLPPTTFLRQSQYYSQSICSLTDYKNQYYCELHLPMTNYYFSEEYKQFLYYKVGVGMTGNPLLYVLTWALNGKYTSNRAFNCA